MSSPGSSDRSAREDHDHGPLLNPEKQVIRRLYNASDLNIDWGDVVRLGNGSNSSFVSNTTVNFSAGWLGVAQAPIGSNTVGPVLLSGYTPVINVGSNSTTRGFFLFGSNMARRAYGAASRTTGAFGQVLTTSVAPDAIIWSTTDGSGGSLTDHDHTAAGDGGDLTAALVSNFMDYTEQISAPGSPASGKVRLFGSNTNLYQQDSGGVVTRLSGSGGGSGSSATYDKLTADETGKTDATLVDTGLSFAVTNAVYYMFRFHILWRSTSATVGLKLGLTTPTFTVFGAQVRIAIVDAGTSAGEVQGSITASGDSVFAGTAAAANTNYIAVIEGVILPSANGTLMVQYAAETTGATVTMKQGSAGELTALP